MIRDELVDIFARFGVGVTECVGSFVARMEGDVTIRTWLATRLRYAADRLDDSGAPKRIGWSFTHEGRDGMRFREDGRGAPLWYVEADYDRAHNEADTPHLRVNWQDGTASTVGGRPWPTT